MAVTLEKAATSALMDLWEHAPTPESPIFSIVRKRSIYIAPRKYANDALETKILFPLLHFEFNLLRLGLCAINKKKQKINFW